MTAVGSLAEFVTAALLGALQAEQEAGAEDKLHIRRISVSLVYGTEGTVSATEDEAWFNSVDEAERWLAERDRPILGSRRRLVALPADRLGRLSLHLDLLPGKTVERQIG